MHIIIKFSKDKILKPEMVKKFDITESYVYSGDFYSAMFIDKDKKVRIYRLYDDLDELIELVNNDIVFKNRTVVFCLSHNDAFQGIRPLNNNLLTKNDKKIIKCNIGVVLDTKATSEDKELCEIYDVLRDKNVRKYISDNKTQNMLRKFVGSNCLCVLNAPVNVVNVMGSSWYDYHDTIYYSRYMSNTQLDAITGQKTKTTVVKNESVTSSKNNDMTNWFGDLKKSGIKIKDIKVTRTLKRKKKTTHVSGRDEVMWVEWYESRLTTTYTDKTTTDFMLIFKKNDKCKCPACLKHISVTPLSGNIHICEKCHIIYSSAIEKAIAYNDNFDIIEIIKLFEETCQSIET